MGGVIDRAARQQSSGRVLSQEQITTVCPDSQSSLMETSLHYQLLDGAPHKQVCSAAFSSLTRPQVMRTLSRRVKRAGHVYIHRGHTAFRHGGISWRTDDLDSLVEKKS